MKVLIAFFVNTLFNFAIGLLVAKFLGPDQFGRFALALAVGVLIQTALFDWIRLTAVRFYSERSRRDRPELRATLDVTFAIVAFAVAIVTVVIMLCGFTFSLSNSLVVLAAAAAIANGLFDYHTALVRARFHDTLYSRLIITKNFLALLLTAGGAFFFRSAQMALIGVCLSMAGSMLLARGALGDKDARPNLARARLAVDYLRYALPIVGANALYLLIPLANRALVTNVYGFAETGQYSLAFDIGTRVVAAIGTALDVLLFQIAVRADELHGAQRAKEQVAANMGIVFAIMLPATAGLWLILPSLDGLVVPQEFRLPFEHYLTLLLPGLLCYGLMNFAINPIFQIARRTLPMVAAAAVGCCVDAVLILVLPRGADASSFAVAQAAAVAAGLVALIVIALPSRPRWPRARDLVVAIAGTAAMIAAVAPLREWAPGVVTLIVEIVVGAVVYGCFVALFDLAGLRSFASQFVAARRGRMAEAVSAAGTKTPSP